jgi:flavin reductase (DIM6/NTAB) family NADH-FMN oxidoreductase RutF
MGQKAFHSQKYPNPFKPENRNPRGIFKVFQKICRRILAEGKSIAPLISECYANLECKVVDEKMVAKYNFFILKVLKAWIDPTRKDPRTIHHRGRGIFIVAGETIKLPSKMK